MAAQRPARRVSEFSRNDPDDGRMRCPDVLVVGGGIVGAAIAERVAREGMSVTLVDRGEIGRAASWAAAGLLTPVHPWRYPEAMLQLNADSLALWPDLAARLLTETGVDIELRRTGLLSLLDTDEDEAEADSRVAWKRGRGERAERLTAAQALAMEPALAPGIRGALHLPDLAQIRNHRAAPALAAAAAKRGAHILEHTAVLGLLEQSGRVVGARTTAGEISAGVVVLAAGAWSGAVLAMDDRPPSLATVPSRGQILLLRTTPGALRHMVLASGEYLVPRADGRVLAGSTVEYVGFDARVTLRGITQIGAAVARMAPALAEARLEKTWAGLRPDTPDHMPVIGEVRPGLVAATGHFRSGIMLAPITAEIVRQVLAWNCTRDLAPFAPHRAIPGAPE